MRQVIAFSLKCINVNPSGSLLFALFLRKGFRCSAGAILVGMVALVFFPFSLSHATPVLYVPNQFSNTVSVIDGSTYSAIKTISVGQDPYGVGVSPDGKTVFITNMAADTVSVIDADTNTVTNTISVGDFPFGVAVSPDGRYAYVANAADDNISVIDTSGYSVVAHITVGNDPHGLVIHPDGSKLYVTNYSGSTVSVINTSTYSVIKTITVGTAPHGIAIHPSGAYVYTGNVLGDNLSVISTSSNSVIKTINTGKYPFFPAIDSSGQYLYVSNHGSSSVTVVDISSNSVAGNITVGSGPHGISLDATGSRAYVANEGGNSVSVIDTASRTVITTIPVGTTPIAFGKFVLDDSFTGRKTYPYSATYFPVTNKDPAQAKPLGIGPVADGLNTLKLKVEFDQFPGPVDIYLAFYASAMGPDIWLITPGPVLQSISKGIVPWKSATTGPIDEALFGEIPMSTLPAVTYNFYVLVSPPGSRESYNLWTTSFLGQYQIMDVAKTIVDKLGGDQGFEATLLAMDNGYSLRQLVDAAMSGRLPANGDISDDSGGVEAPANPPFGIIIRSAAQAQVPQETQYGINILLERVFRILAKGGLKVPPDDAGQKALIIGILMGMQNAGYDLPKGAEAIMDGRVKVKIDGKNLTAALTDADGKDLPPENPTGGQGVFSDPPGMCGPDDDKDGDQYWPAAHCPQSVRFGVDCNDGNANINPGMIEVCGDTIDDDCNPSNDVCCPNDFPISCPPHCYTAGSVCCGAGNACEAGFFCNPLGGCCSNSGVVCGTGCMPAGSVCCGSGPSYCPAGYECVGGGCMSSSATISECRGQIFDWVK